MHNGPAVIGSVEGVAGGAEGELVSSSRWGDVANIDSYMRVSVWPGLCVNNTKSMEYFMSYKSYT